MNRVYIFYVSFLSEEGNMWILPGHSEIALNKYSRTQAFPFQLATHDFLHLWMVTIKTKLCSQIHYFFVTYMVVGHWDCLPLKRHSPSASFEKESPTSVFLSFSLLDKVDHKWTSVPSGTLYATLLRESGYFSHQ